MTNFLRCLPVILGFEGGYTDDKNDPGGATNRGITQGTYDAWRRHANLPVQPVLACTEAETQTIYFSNYWVAAGCGALDLPVALVVFDSAVQHGVGRALGFLSEVGPSVDALCDRRDRYYHGIVALHPTEAVFLKGWLARLATLRATATAWAADGSPPPAPLAA